MPTASPASSDLALDVRGVAKTYRGKIRALRGIDLAIGRGEVFGLLGPNGAGKSTLVKILMTVIRPSACAGTMLGAPVGHKPTLARIGYLPEHHRFPGYLTARQVVEHFGALAGVARADRRARSEALLDMVGLNDWKRKRVRQFSKGMRQRLGIAQALINNPDLVLLDEPTDGVDPIGRRDIRDMLARMKGEGKTVFLNSHLLSELEMVCDRVAILVQGEVASQGTIHDLTVARRFYEFEFAHADPARAEAAARAALRISPPGAGSRASLPDGAWAEPEGLRLRIGTADPDRIQPALDALRAAGLTIRALRPVRPSLEDLFVEAVGDRSHTP